MHVILIHVMCMQHREMFHGRRWMSDERFLTPMIDSQHAGHVFIGDFIRYRAGGDGTKMAKVKLFFKKVCHAHLSLLIRYANCCRRETVKYISK